MIVNKRKRGFSLLELILALSVGSAIALIKFQNMVHEQEDIQAAAVGQQIKQVGEAVNRYIAVRFDKLSTLSAAASTGSDPGPRTCSNSTCTITYETLINEGLLPSSFAGINANKSEYKIVLKRDGTSPNYVINGLVTTTDSWSDDGKVRYDLLGKAMYAAGIDSAMTKSTTQADGFKGAWSEKSSDFSNITKAGQLAYRVGYDSSMYSVYLRRDGTLPMTGNLNMGENDINSAKDITASGTGTFGGEVTAHNGYGDAITLGGTDDNDYEIRLGSAKPLTVYSPEAGSNTVIFQVGNDTKLQRIGTNGYSPSDMPTGWTGGVRTWDVLAGGTVGVLPKGTSTASGTTTNDLAAYINQNGHVYASTLVKSGGDIEASGNLSVSGSAEVDGAITSSSTITSNERLTTNEYLKINKIASVGASCSDNGLQARTTDGLILSCVSGIWKSANISDATNYYGDIKCTNKTGQSIAYCPSGTTMISGGWQMTSWSDDDGRNSPDSSYPDPSINGWRMTAPGGEGGCFRAVVMCSK